jgi:glycosyltransferase involved in cell wall biosynthesis
LRPILEQRGHIVKIFASDDRPDMPHFNDYSFRAHLGLLRPFFHAFNPNAYQVLKKVLKEFKPDVVHIHTFGHGSPAILFPLKQYPTLLTVHGPEAYMKNMLFWCFPDSYFRGKERKIKNLRLIGMLRLIYHRCIIDPLYSLGFRNINTIISPSLYMQKIMMQDGLESVYIPNGMLLFACHPVTKETLSQSIIYVGRLKTFKGVDHLLRAFANIRKQFPRARLLIAGNGSEGRNLKQLAVELGIDDATEFYGYVGREKIEDLYARSALSVVPSTWAEAFGLVGIEAMSVGRPVIASNVGGISEWLINGRTGYLVKPADSAALGEAITRLFSNPELLLEMMKNARVQAKNFSIEKHADRILGVYTETVLRRAKIK